MIYRAIGVMSGSSLDGLDIAFTTFTETGGKWTFEIIEAECIPYSSEWQLQLKIATSLPALDYQLLHTSYGHYIGDQINQFIHRHELHHKVNLVASHGHTSFHLPGQKMTAQLGDGAAIAATTKLNVVSDLRALDVALGGQGAPIVPIGEKLLFTNYACFLNIGGIANLSVNAAGKYIAFDVCAANRILNMLANETGMPYDDGGQLAAKGQINPELLTALNALEYYSNPYPKSLANDFGTDIVFPMIKNAGISTDDALRTYAEHISVQVRNAIAATGLKNSQQNNSMLVTGGGALNYFLIACLHNQLAGIVSVVVPDHTLVQYKEAVIMGLLGVLRWREEATVLPSVTGASRESIGGALWLG